MAIIESVAAFESRARAFGINDADRGAVAAKGLNTFAAFAFLVPYNPSGVGEDAVLREALKDVLGHEPDTTGMAKFRRLQFESHTQMLSDTKARLERTDEHAPRKLPGPERAARHKDQLARLVSVQITQDNEPSHALLDLAQQMVEDAQIRHIGLEKCTSRVHELQGIKLVEGVVKDPNGSIRLVSKEAGPTADLSTDYKIRQAFLRRSLALDQANLISYEVHERWVNSLFSAMARVPPLRYNAVTLEQVLACDLELFVCLGEGCREGVGLDIRGRRIVEEEMKLLMCDNRITFLLQPLPVGNTSHSAALASNKRAHDTALPSLSRSQLKKQRQAVNKAKGPAPATEKGKGKGKGKTKGVSMPDGLSGCWAKVNGENVCFSFNLGRCQEQGARCNRGVHKCCAPNCGGLHSYQACPTRTPMQ